MKNIYKNLIFCALTLAALNSCTEEEELIGFPLDLNTTTTALVGTVASPATKSFEGKTIAVTVTLPQSFQSDADVEVSALFNSGSLTTSTVTVPAGQTTATGTITLPSGDGFDSGKLEGLVNFCKLSLTSILLSDLEVGKAYTISSDDFSINILDKYTAYTTAVAAGRMNYLLDWANPGINDLDAYVGALENSETGDRYESDIWNAGRPDGNYTIEVGLYDIAEASIPWTLFFVHPDQLTVDILEGTFTNLTIGTGLNANRAIVNFTQTTNATTGKVTFTATLAN